VRFLSVWLFIAAFSEFVVTISVYLIASNACSGPVTLRLAYLELRGTDPPRARKLGGGWGFRAVREGRV